MGLRPWPPGEEPTCPNCGEPAAERGPSSRTMMSVSRGYDDDGEYHVHDPNVTKTNLTCEKGHSWVKKKPSRSCPARGCDR